MKEQYFFMGTEIEYEQLSEKVKRKIIARGGDMMIVEVHFQKGGVGDMHEHFHEQVTYCTKGKIEFTVDGEKRVITEGDSIFMPKHSLHGAVALEDSIVLDVFTPQREDFLKKD